MGKNSVFDINAAKQRQYADATRAFQKRNSFAQGFGLGMDYSLDEVAGNGGLFDPLKKLKVRYSRRPGGDYTDGMIQAMLAASRATPGTTRKSTFLTGG